jgi:hypothetical protein
MAKTEDTAVIEIEDAVIDAWQEETGLVSETDLDALIKLQNHPAFSLLLCRLNEMDDDNTDATLGDLSCKDPVEFYRAQGFKTCLTILKSDKLIARAALLRLRRQQDKKEGSLSD